MSTGGTMLLMMLLSACTNSGLGKPTTTGTGDTGATTAAADCPWVGQWTLQTVSCSAFDVTPDWQQDYTGATVEISQADAGGCEVVATITGAECEEVESWHLTPPVGIQTDLTHNGITSCNPDACVFGTADAAPCSVGDRATGAQGVSVEDVNGELRMSRILQYTAPENCSLDLITTWAK